MTSTTRTRAIIALGAVALGTVAGAAGATVASAGSARLVYVCPDTQGHASSCAHNQEFEVFDRNGAPIFSVGETGGSGVYGDNSSVYSPRSVYSPAVTTSYTDPGTYNRTFRRANTCTAPAAWIEPHGIWSCQGGHWAKKVSL